MLRKPDGNDEKLTQTYIWATIFGGGAVYFLAAYYLDVHVLDLRFLFVAVLTLFLSSRIAIKIPQFSSHISVSDTFIFLTLLLSMRRPPSMKVRFGILPQKATLRVCRRKLPG